MLGGSHFAFHAWWCKRVFCETHAKRVWIRIQYACKHASWPPHYFWKSVESRSRRYEGPTVPLTIQISIHSHCTALGLDRDPCPLVECYIVWEPNGLLSVGMNAQNRNTHVQVQTRNHWHFFTGMSCVEAFQRSAMAMHARSVKAHHWFEEHFSNSLELLHVLNLPWNNSSPRFKKECFLKY